MNAMTKMTRDLTNARIVLADRVIEQGWLAVADGRIAEIGEGRAPAARRGYRRRFDHARPDRAAYRPPRSALRAAAESVLASGRRRRCPMTASSRHPASPPCSIRSGSGATTAPSEVDGRAGTLADAHHSRARCRSAARRALPASALRNRRRRRRRARPRTDRPSRRPADVADGPHARPAPVPRRRQAARLLSRQGWRQDRCRARRVRSPSASTYQKAYAATNMRRDRRAGAANTACRSRAMTTPPRSTSSRRCAIGVAVAEFPTTLEAARGLHEAGIDILMGAPERRARRLAFRQHRRGRSRPRRPARHPVVGLHSRPAC